MSNDFLNDFFEHSFRDVQSLQVNSKKSFKKIHISGNSSGNNLAEKESYV